MAPVVPLGARISILSSVFSHSSSQHHPHYSMSAHIFLDITTANAPNPEVGTPERAEEAEGTGGLVATQSPEDVLAHVIHFLDLMPMKQQLVSKIHSPL